MTTRRRAAGLATALLAVVSLTFPSKGLGAPAWEPDPTPPTELAPAAPPGPTQVVVYDRFTRTSVVASHDGAGVPGSASSSRPSISADGSVVAFESAAALVSQDTNGLGDVYAWQRTGDQVARVSIGREGQPANGDSRDPSVSGDGGVIAFASTARNVSPTRGFDGTSQVFAWRRSTGSITLVSSTPDGAPGNGGSGAPSASLDGRVVGFESSASDLVDGDTTGARDVFLRDLAQTVTIRASLGADGRQVSADSRRASVSGDGGAVAFDSTGGGLAPPDSNKVRDVFVRDLPPAVQVTPNPLDFGVVPLGTPASLTVTVLSIGWTPVVMTTSTIGGTDPSDFVVAGDLCLGLTLPNGATCSIAVLHVPTASGPRSATLEISDNALGSPQIVELIGGVPAPQLRLEPQVGPPGIVTVAIGENFPPGALVTFRWDQGISQPLAPIAVGPDGTFSVGILVFHHDRLGPRQLLVTAAPGGANFTDKTADFLVVPPPLQPPGSSALSFLAPELRLILIRR